MVRADFCARSGVHFAVAKLQEQLLKKTEDPSDPWYPVDWLHGAARRGPAFAAEDRPYTLELSEPFGPCSTASFSLEVEDAASGVNVNAGDNLAVILDNLCRILGPPLVAADPDLLQPRRWATEGADASLYNCNPADTPAQLDICYKPGPDARPITWAGFHAAYGAAAGALGVDLSSKPTDGRAVYGDGYAIAGFRARHGRFQSLQDVKQALTYVERNGNGRPDDPLEQLEIEVKFAVLKDYLTVDSWVDTTTVGVGKFEWAVPCSSGEWDTLIDRDKGCGTL